MGGTSYVLCFAELTLLELDFANIIPFSYSFYELEVRTNETRKFNELYTRRAMVQLLMIFELAHVVVGARFLKLLDR